jgi:nucleoporin GLE1
MEQEDSPTAFPVAYVIRRMCSRDHDLRDVVLGYIHTVCPFTVPYYVGKRADQSTEQYMEALGYQRQSSSPNGFESEASYSNRIEGILCLYFAVLQTPMPIKPDDPLNMNECWRWLARLLNTHPTYITPLLLRACVKMAFYRAQRVFGKPFEKLVVFILQDFLPRMHAVADCDTATLAWLRARLVDKLAESRGKFPMPPGCDFFTHTGPVGGGQ